MGPLDFLASLAKSTAWPAVVVFAILFLQTQIRDLLGSISELSIGKDGFTGKWERGAEQVRTGILMSYKAGKSTPEVASFLTKALEITPPESNAARITDAWRNLEQALQERLTQADVIAPSLRGATLIRQVRTHNLITEDQARSLLGLNVMRNLAEHGRSGELTDARVEEFLALADAMKTVLEISRP